MKKKVLVVEGDDIKYASLSKQLYTLSYSTDSISRIISFQESLSYDTEDIGVVLVNFCSVSNISPGLQSLRNHFKHVPVIVLSDMDDKDASIEAIQNGAQDFLVYGDFTAVQLGKSISFAIERKARTTKIINLAAEYEKHFDNGPIPMLIADTQDMKILVVNKAAIEKYGYTEKEFSNMSLLDIRPIEDTASFLERFYQRTNEYYDAGYSRHLKKDGTIFHVHVYDHATVFNSVEARLCFLVDVDGKIVADKKNAELAGLIKEQKKQLDSILYSISDAIWSRRADTMELVYANNAYYKMFGYERETARTDKEHVLNAVYPDDMPEFLKAMEDITTTGEVDIVYRYTHLDGSLKILKAQAKLRKGAEGQPDIINGVTNDITQEKQLYDAIRNSEQKLRATINNTKDLIWSVNPNLEIIFCNEPYQEFIYGLTGLMPEEGNFVLAESSSESFIATRKKDYKRALEGESFTTITEEIYEGDVLYLEISSSPVINHEGRIVGVNCVARDISVQRKQLLKIQQQNEKLKEIAWIQSHKVRGPVASILGLIPLFDYEAGGNENNADILLKLQSATNDLDDVIKEIVGSINAVDRN